MKTEDNVARKPYTIESFKEGITKAITRDGQTVDILVWDMNVPFPLEGQLEGTRLWSYNGKYDTFGKIHPLDLFEI